MLDGPTAAVVITAILGVVASIIKFVPARSNGRNGDTSGILQAQARMEEQIKQIVGRLDKLDDKVDAHAKTFIEWLRGQQ